MKNSNIFELINIYNNSISNRILEIQHKSFLETNFSHSQRDRFVESDVYLDKYEVGSFKAEFSGLKDEEFSCKYCGDIIKYNFTEELWEFIPTDLLKENKMLFRKIYLWPFLKILLMIVIIFICVLGYVISEIFIGDPFFYHLLPIGSSVTILILASIYYYVYYKIILKNYDFILRQTKEPFNNEMSLFYHQLNFYYKNHSIIVDNWKYNGKSLAYRLGKDKDSNYFAPFKDVVELIITDNKLNLKIKTTWL